MSDVVQYGIDDLRKAIHGKTKPQKIDIVEKAMTDFGLYQMSPSKKSIMYEGGFDQNAALLLDELIHDNSYKYESDWNWFFNADNVPNQSLVFETKDFLETKRKDIDSLLMFNILWRQMDELKTFFDKPVDFVERLSGLPLNEIQKHILFGLLLRWHGGYPINNLNPKYDTILKLIEKSFLAMFPDELTPEKEFCATDIKTAKKLMKQKRMLMLL